MTERIAAAKPLHLSHSGGLITISDGSLKLGEVRLSAMQWIALRNMILVGAEECKASITITGDSGTWRIVDGVDVAEEEKDDA